MKYLYLVLTLLFMILFDFYLKENIIETGGEGGVALPFLLVVIILGAVLSVWRAFTSPVLHIKHSTFFLVLFGAYLVFRLGVDTGSVGEIKAYVLGTTGGTLLFYTLGMMMAITIGQIFDYGAQSKSYRTFLALGFILYMAVSFGSLLTLFFELYARLRSDIYLISDINGNYQRSGDFLVIVFLVLSTLYAHVIALNQGLSSKMYKFLSPVFFVTYLGYGFLSMAIAQMIGSNKAAVVIVGLILTLVIMCFLIFFRRVKRYLACQQLSISRVVWGVVGRRIFFIVMVGGAFLIIMAIALEIDLSSTRIGGFGDGEISSITSRVNLLINFISQFAYSPIFGNMTVDALTTGPGSYVHSFLISTLTHLGIVGFILIVSYLILAYRERFKFKQYNSNRPEQCLVNNILNLYSMMAFSVILLIGIVGTFFTWATIWFAMGLLIVAVRFDGRKNKY